MKKSILTVLILLMCIAFIAYWNWVLAIPIFIIVLTILLMLRTESGAAIDIMDILKNRIDNAVEKEETDVGRIMKRITKLSDVYEEEATVVHDAIKNLASSMDKSYKALDTKLIRLLYLSSSPTKITVKDTCPHCKGKDLIKAIVKAGTESTNTGYICPDCGYTSYHIIEKSHGKTDTKKRKPKSP